MPVMYSFMSPVNLKKTVRQADFKMSSKIFLKRVSISSSGIADKLIKIRIVIWRYCIIIIRILPGIRNGTVKV